MTEDYAVRRREYIRQIRESFDMPEQTEEETEGREHLVSYALSFKIRAVIAILAMTGFLIAWQSDYEMQGYHAKDLVDIISDNNYYTILQDYVMINK